MDPVAPVNVQTPLPTVPPQPVIPPPLSSPPSEVQTPPNSSSPLLKRLVIILSVIVILGTFGIGLYLIWSRFPHTTSTNNIAQTSNAGCTNNKVYSNVTEALLVEGKDVCYIDAKAPNEEYVFPTDLLTKPHTRKIVSLSLDGYNLSSMNESLVVFTGIKVLRFKNAQLSALPKGVDKLSNLEELDLTGNQFDETTKAQIRQQLPKVKIAF